MISSIPKAKASLDVALINMPFASFRQPSFALGILKSALKDEFNVKVFDFNVTFSEKIGVDLYDKISTWHIVDLLGDRLFAEMLYGNNIPTFEEYVDQVLIGNLKEHKAPYDKPGVDAHLSDELLKVQSSAGSFLEEISKVVAKERPKIAAFTSMFHQQVASLALARRIKEVLPNTTVVFGGANCKGAMGLEFLAKHPFVDAICLGEGDTSFKKFVGLCLEGFDLGGLSKVDGIVTPMNLKSEGEKFSDHYRHVLEMDMGSVPIPDYDDFANIYRKRRSDSRGKPRLFFEMSRGCYWGQKKRCIFCGQSSETLVFRKKNRGRIVSEVRTLASKYEGFSLCASDESADKEMLEALADALSAFEKKPEIIYLQVRPDIDFGLLEKLSACGLKRLEVGIESLSSRVLSIIGKGVSALQNIAFLKGCREAKIMPVWNFLWGFPGEPVEAYENMAKLVPLLTHLHPPNYAGQFRLDRFSPCFEDPSGYGIKDVSPYPSYSYVYPFDDESVSNLASFFTFEYQLPQNCAEYTHELMENIFFWKEIHPKSSLCFSRDEEGLIIDRRSGEGEWHIKLDPFTLAVCKACSKPVTIEAIALSLSEKGFVEDENNIKQSIINLIKYGMVLKEGEMLLSLVTEEEVMP